jgi:adenylate kinase family enzyme
MLIGPGNAGKSTLAVELGNILGLPVYHLDRIFWLPNWVAKDRELFINEQKQIVAKENWIIEGDFKNSYDIRAERADTIIFLNIPRRLLIPRFFKRVYKYRGRTRPDITEGNIEKVNLEYLKWLYNYDRNIPKELISKYRDSKTVYILDKPKEIEKFLLTLDPKR